MNYDSYMGAIGLFAGTYAPNGWMICAGQLLPTAQYSGLYTLLGNRYGSDTGKFALPNLTGRVAVGAGGVYEIGQQGGNEAIVLTSNTMPAHQHAISASVNVTLGESDAPSNTNQPSADVTLGQSQGTYGRDALTVRIYAPAPASVQLPAQLQAGVTVQPLAGQSQPVRVIQPVLALNQCICVGGVYPTPNDD